MHGGPGRKGDSEAVKKLIDTKDPAKQARLEEAFDQTLHLLNATQHPVGAPVQFNPAFVCAAEKIPAAAAGATAADYLEVLKKTLGHARARVTIDRDVYTAEVGGETFSVIDVTLTHPDAVGHQRYYTHIRRGYALSLILVYLTPEQLRTLTGVVESVRLR